jgi:hypothetical protein
VIGVIVPGLVGYGCNQVPDRQYIEVDDRPRWQWKTEKRVATNRISLFWLLPVY